MLRSYSSKCQLKEKKLLKTCVECYKVGELLTLNTT